MLRRILVFVSLLLSTASNAQQDSAISIILGFGAGLPIFQPIDEQDYAVNVYSEARDHTTQLQLGVRFAGKSKNKFEVLYKRTRFKIDIDELTAEYENRFTDQYFYPAYTIGNQSLSGHRPSLNSFNCNYGREVGESSKLSFFPYVGLGIGLLRQFDFYYMLRDKNSNYATEYEIDIKTTVQPTYTMGVRFGVKNYSTIVGLDLSIHGGLNNYRYDVNATPQDPAIPAFQAQVSYWRFVQSVNLTLVLAINLDDSDSL